MPLRFRQRILDHLAGEHYSPTTVREIARHLRIAPEERATFERAVDDLVSEAALELDEGGRLRLPRAPAELTGRIRVNARGFGFVIPDQAVREGDIFIPPDQLADAVSGDLVRIRLVKRHGHFAGGDAKRSRVGRVVEIVERGQSNFVGTLRKQGRDWIVEPDGTTLRDPVVIRDPHAKNAREGDKVVIEITAYPEGVYLAEGVIVEVLGEAGKPSVETQAVIAAHGLRQKFVEEVVAEARRASHAFDEDIESDEAREDLRDLFTLTIDPPDAKDFDDAITISYDKKAAEWTLGVHIADVANFVKRGRALDREAIDRGNSVYLPRLVLPMLPEVLSNGVCSLQEGVPRLTKSAFIQYDDKGRVTGQRLCNSIIQSNRRLTYLEAQALIDGNEKEARKHARTEPDYRPALIETLRKMDELAKIIRARRRREGMISLNLPEVELIFGEDGHVIGVVPEDDAFTHTIIEMFMVEANEAVARTFDDLGVPIIRRIHPDPTTSKMAELQEYAMVAGVRIPANPTRKDIQNLLERTDESPAARAIHLAVLKTLTRAAYSPALIGHYALASEHYTHFTSPIRRYPDLSVHRVVEAYLEMTENGRNVPGGRKRKKLGERLIEDKRVLDEDDLINLGRHCTEMEEAAEDAERELRDFLVMQFLDENHLGGEFAGVVTGVTNGGVFVSIEKFLVEGLVKVEDLPDTGRRGGRWRIDDRTNRLTERLSGLSIGLGDEVTIQIAAIDLASRHMDLLITRMPARGAHRVEQEKARGGKRTRSQQKADQRRRAKRKDYGKGRRGGRRR